jgi:hypothetical protein
MAMGADCGKCGCALEWDEEDEERWWWCVEVVGEDEEDG